MIRHDGEELHAHAKASGYPIIRRDTNTFVIELSQDEVLAIVAELANAAYMGDVYLVAEKVKIHKREVFD